ncbi:MAG: hypothetical protein Q9162_004069 [Coniocarpon cinnabarinum]
MGGGPYKEHILVALPVNEPTTEIEKLKARFPGVEVVYAQAGADGIPVELYKPATILFTLFGYRSQALPPNPHVDAPNLKYVHFYSAGVNFAVNHPIYTHTSIPLTSANGVHGPQISEWLIMTRLAAARNYDALHDAQRDHVWAKTAYHDKSFSNYQDQVSQRVGVLGYGAIGRQTARVAVNMGMTVVAYTASPKTTPESRRDDGFIVPGTGDPDGSYPSEWYSGTDKASLHRFLAADLDWVVVSVPLTPATKHLLGHEEFKILSKRNAFISNISRGDIIDQDALIEAVKKPEKGGKGWLRGAALDVTSPEPLPSESELWDLDGVTITPHISGLTTRYTERCFEILSLNIERREKGEKLINEVNRKRGY